MESKIAFNIFIILILRNPRILCLLYANYTLCISPQNTKEKRQLEIKNKIIEKSGYQEVFDDNNNIDGSNYSDYNSIKDAVHSKLRN